MNWYTHLVEIDSIMIELDQMNLSKEEKLHLAHLVDSSLHHTIVNVVLSQLSEEDKRRFVNHLNENDNDKIWKFLNEKVDNLEAKIKKSAEELKSEMNKDLREARKRV